MATNDAVIRDLQLALRDQSALEFSGSQVHNEQLIVVVDLDTTKFERVDGGLPVEASERLYVMFPRTWPWIPPLVEVSHDRWLDQPHVLQGRRLCLYLDPDGEWDPSSGMPGFLRRLLEWFEDAIANRFNAATALYHPVGGVLHRTPGAPTVVVRQPLDWPSHDFGIARIQIQKRSDHQFEVISWDRRQVVDGTFPGLLVVLSKSLPLGGGQYLSDIAVAIRDQDDRGQRKQFLNSVDKTRRALRADQDLHVILAVPNRRLSGDSRYHLIGWRLAHDDIESAIAAAKSRHKPTDPHPANDPHVEWTYVDDNRPSVTTRRDQKKPVTWFQGKAIELWGCGALGSWIAESVVRSGAKTVILRDPGFVTSGLLVRQNYEEKDIGLPKVEALSRRLAAISGDTTVIPVVGIAQSAVNEAGTADAVFDCTVNTSVARTIEIAQTNDHLTTPVVQAATDLDTATLAVLTIVHPIAAITTNALDDLTRDTVRGKSTLSAFRTFWDNDAPPPVIPTLGCSVPTFIGSSADAMAVAAMCVSLAAFALERRLSVGYLLAAAHTPYGVPLCTRVVP